MSLQTLRIQPGLGLECRRGCLWKETRVLGRSYVLVHVPACLAVAYRAFNISTRDFLEGLQPMGTCGFSSSKRLETAMWL